MMKLQLLIILNFCVFVAGITAQGSNHTKADKTPSNSEKLKNSFDKDLTKSKLLEINLRNRTKLLGFIHEINEDKLILINPENGLATNIKYSQVKNIKSAPLNPEFAKLAKNPSLKTYWENFFRRTINNAAVGYSYAIYQDGKPITVGAYGYDKFPKFPNEAGVPMSLQTRVQLASVSKPITAIALLHAMEKKGISLDTKFWTILKTQFPDLTKPGKGVEDITIAQLLTHTSGYPFGYVETPRLKNLHDLLVKPVPNPAGEKSVYSNINFSIARTLIEAITGQEYEKYVREELFRLAGAEGITLQVEKLQAAFAYQAGDYNGEPMATDFRDEAGAYGWYATAEEAARFFGLVRDFKYLSPEMTKIMFERNLGWGASETPAGTVYRHDGQWIIENNRGVRTAVALLPENITAVLLINTDSRIPTGELLARGFSENIPRLVASNLDKTKKIVRVELPVFTDEVLCTMDGSNPTRASMRYIQPISVQIPATIKCQGFLAGSPITFVNTLELK